MADARDRAVVEAHALRTATATAALLHGSRRGPRQLRRPYAAVVASLVVGALLMVAVWAISTIGELLAEQRRERARADRVTAVPVVRVPAPGPTGYAPQRPL
ncbi:hypothetical protein CA850_04770 [Micromonospora echinospora]|uniref:Uncharacterized protein n=1 Tax=Micromonospora echinospora TaxID=1877 RepID=A0A1C4ZVC1_MICEC|nr:hypothetical protein [Micromonospora echinospora]OZV83945.1 hypothetical protein CA850_04770 [Micromonospora echinospora]SCF36826.1 hypothetical protein GA0070618_5828 [Micromonospora echinospora]